MVRRRRLERNLECRTGCQGERQGIGGNAGDSPADSQPATGPEEATQATLPSCAGGAARPGAVAEVEPIPAVARAVASAGCCRRDRCGQAADREGDATDGNESGKNEDRRAAEEGGST